MKEIIIMTREEKVKEIIMEYPKATKEECKPEASFIEDLGADSIDLVEMISAKLTEIIMKYLKVTKEECKPEASFIEDLGADSIDLVEMITAMEESFEIKITDSDLENIRTIQDAIDFLKRRSVQ
jgi:acyl carrier protein